MEYFSNLRQLLLTEKEEDRRIFEQLTLTLPVNERRENGMTWFPVAIRDSEPGLGDYLTVEVERTSHQDIMHQLRFGMTAALFSNYQPKTDRLEGTITHISGNRLKLALRVDELPRWTREGRLGVDAVFDDNSYTEMEQALRAAAERQLKKQEGRLVRVLTGMEAPEFFLPEHLPVVALNAMQRLAVEKILAAKDLAIVHGPPGTGKTTTLVQAIAAMWRRDQQQVLVTAPSNAAVDLLSERLTDAGLNVVRVGNPARVSEKQLQLTLDHRMDAHASMKEIRRLKKQAAEYRDLAQKYKRSFGPAEREQRKALFAEARNIRREIENTEQYIANDILDRAHVITATLVGASHYTIRKKTFRTVVIDEAGQSIEPACWIPVLRADRLIMAGDHCQLPPTIKSLVAERGGLGKTLMEKCVEHHPEAVVLLEEQYRMHAQIMNFSSQEFYQGRLVANDGVASHVLFPGDRPLLFIDTAGCGYEEQREDSGISNPEEAALLLRHLAQLMQHFQDDTAPSVAVISPYRHQVELLKEMYRSFSWQPGTVSINTIDSFQGQERDVVYISMTRSNSDNSIGFLSEVRRMNVAMTRARKKLVVIGDSATLSQYGFYGDFISYAQAHDGYVSAWEL
ncbi:MAG TPA: AAA domain-containing protein [Flavisolibacter sp.]